MFIVLKQYRGIARRAYGPFEHYEAAQQAADSYTRAVDESFCVMEVTSEDEESDQ